MPSLCEAVASNALRLAEWGAVLLVCIHVGPLQREDVWDIHRHMTTGASMDALDGTGMLDERHRRRHYLLLGLYEANKREFWWSALYRLGQELAQLVQPLLLADILRFLGDPSVPVRRGVLSCTLLFCAACLKTLLENHYFITCVRAGIRARAACIHLVYQLRAAIEMQYLHAAFVCSICMENWYGNIYVRTLRIHAAEQLREGAAAERCEHSGCASPALSPLLLISSYNSEKSLCGAESSTGQIVNLMSSDAGRMQWALPFMHWMPAGLLQIAIAVSMLWGLLGPSLLVGIITCAVLSPLTAWTTTRFHKYNSVVLQKRDVRVQKVNASFSSQLITRAYVCAR